MVTSFKPRIRLTFLVLFAAITLLSALILFSYLDERKRAEIEFNNSRIEASKLHAQKFQEKFEVIYRELRTIARLPSVKSLNLKNKNISADSRITIQEIYNSIFESFHISELYIVPAEFDPNKPKSERNANEPLITFDEFITQRSSIIGKEAPQKSSALKEVESFEYKLMKSQIQFFNEHYSSLDKIKELEYPIISGPPVITCDNSQIKTDAPSDIDRTGLVFSVPFYNNSGVFSGMISGVILISKIRQLLDSAELELENQAYGIRIANNASLEKTDSKISNSIDLNLNDAIGRWKLVSKFDAESYRKSKAYVQLQQKYFFILLIFSILSFGMFLYLTNASRLQQWRERKNLELTQKLDDKTKELEESAQLLVQTAKLSTLGEMATGIAHEVSNPLAVISSKAEKILSLLKDKNLNLPPNELEATCSEIAKSAQKIVDMVTKTTKIVKGLRSFARQGENDPLEPYSVPNLIQESIELTEHKLKTIHVQLKVSEVPNLEIACRSTQIDQVIVNLINNAVDAIESRPDPWIRIDVDSNEDYVFIRITDCGPGIPKDIQEKILNPFFTTKEAGKGTGVGLSISRTIMKEHRGSLSYNPNSPNTQFVLSFPILKAKAA